MKTIGTGLVAGTLGTAAGFVAACLGASRILSDLETQLAKERRSPAWVTGAIIHIERAKTVGEIEDILNTVARVQARQDMAIDSAADKKRASLKPTPRPTTEKDTVSAQQRIILEAILAAQKARGPLPIHHQQHDGPYDD
jgi:hypothetical protein